MQLVLYDYTKYTAEATRYRWDGSAAVCGWDGDEGEVEPEHHELEQTLFGSKLWLSIAPADTNVTQRVD